MSIARPVLLAILALATGLLASCGGGNGTSEPSLPAGHEGVAVIEGWVETLSKGDVEGAAGYFALPSVTENGTPPITLRSHADVIAFNRSLPCGARLVRARPLGRFIAATFRLTDRPGGDCGPGIGQLARTAFVIRDGKIAQWRRLSNPPRNQGGGGPIVWPGASLIVQTSGRGAQHSRFPAPSQECRKLGTQHFLPTRF